MNMNDVLLCAGITIGIVFFFVCVPCFIGNLIKKAGEALEKLHREE